MAQSIEQARFEDFTEAQYAELLDLGDVIERPAGHLLIAEGETTDHVFLVLRGHAKVEFADGVGRTLELFGPGEVVGDSAVLLSTPRTADVTTLTPVSALLIPGSGWLDFLERHPRAMRKQLIRNRRALLAVNRRRVEDRHGAERRLAIALTEIGAKQLWNKVDGRTIVRFTQEELAGFTGLGRDSVVKVFRQFKAAGIIEVRRGVTTILDTERLGRIARGTATAAVA